MKNCSFCFLFLVLCDVDTSFVSSPTVSNMDGPICLLFLTGSNPGFGFANFAFSGNSLAFMKM